VDFGQTKQQIYDNFVVAQGLKTQGDRLLVFVEVFLFNKQKYHFASIVAL
jgi:hypothetical protein